MLGSPLKYFRDITTFSISYFIIKNEITLNYPICNLM